MSKSNTPKVVLAQVSPEVVSKAATATAKAVVTCEKAKRTLLTSVSAAIAGIEVGLNAVQYDRQFKPYLSQGFAPFVKRGDISQKTADQYASKLKTAVLAIVNKLATPNAGETFWEFYDRAATAVAAGKLADGSPVWEASAKKGRKVGAKVAPKSGGPLPGAVASANSASGADAGGLNVSAQLAAALILAKQNKSRAERLVAVLESYPEAFDKWASGLLSDNSKSDKPKAPIVLKAEEPATALGAALIEAAKPANQKSGQRKAA